MAWDTIATQTASTKRAPAITGGKRGAPVTYLTGLPCTNLSSANPELVSSLGLNTSLYLEQCFIKGADYDIESGDILSLDGVDYPIRYVAKYPVTSNGNDKRYHLVVEVLRR